MPRGSVKVFLKLGKTASASSTVPRPSRRLSRVDRLEMIARLSGTNARPARLKLCRVFGA